MISESQLPELEIFRKIERGLPFDMCLSYGKLVVQNSNDSLPVHRWFKFKEAFSANLLSEILATIIPSLGKQIRLLDPFCGVGTCLLASQEMSAAGYRIDAIGIERNPFIAFVATTKLHWPDIDASSLVRLGEKALHKSKSKSPIIPSLSSLTTGRCLSRHLAKRLLSIKTVICSDGESVTHDALLVGLASAIEPVSNVRKDGRALRIVERTRISLASVLSAKWEAIATDVNFLQKTLGNASVPRIILGDGRRPSRAGIKPGSIDLIVTSPPYPNNIDYSEVYKLELWLLGFIKDQDSFLKLRKSTFRSHPLCGLADNLPEFLEAIRKTNIHKLMQPILSRVKDSEPWRERVLLGYFHDIWVSLSEQYQCLRKGGYSILIVGNSLHGGTHLPYLIPTDIVVAALGELAGFRIEQVMVARALKRRLVSNHFLRESLVILKKDND